jgi:hypothetical protein
VSFVNPHLVEENFTHVVQVVILCAQDVILAGSFRWPESELPQSVEKVLQFIAMVWHLQGRFGYFARLTSYELKLPRVKYSARQFPDTKISRLVAEVAVEVELKAALISTSYWMPHHAHTVTFMDLVTVTLVRPGISGRGHDGIGITSPLRKRTAL